MAEAVAWQSRGRGLAESVARHGSYHGLCQEFCQATG